MTTTLLLGLAIVLGPSALVILSVMRRIFFRPEVKEITSEWLEQFSPDRYRSMASLLANDDFAFLSRQPGFDLSLYRKLRRERLAIFRQYLDRLVMDFERLHLMARLLAAESPEESSDLVAMLFRLQWQFKAALMKTEFEYLLCRFGLATVHVQRLITPLYSLSEGISSLRLATDSLAAL